MKVSGAPRRMLAHLTVSLTSGSSKSRLSTAPRRGLSKIDALRQVFTAGQWPPSATTPP